MAVELVHRSDQKKVLELLEQSGLAYEEGGDANPRDLAFQHILGLNPCLAVGVLKCAL